jgi:type IV pilus assembly protein PilA
LSTDIATATGTITVAFKPSVAAAGVNTITFVPTSALAAFAGTATSSTPPAGGSIDWNCTGGTLVAKYRPSECR